MDVLPLITIPTIFLLIVLIKPHIGRRTGWRICAVCAAVSFTWAMLLVLPWFGIPVDTTTVAILMGMSVSGFMYKLEAYYQAHHLRHLWVARLVVVLGGFLIITLLLHENWQGVLVAGIGTLLLLVIISFLMQGTTHQDAVRSAGRDMKESLLKKLDNCC